MFNSDVTKMKTTIITFFSSYNVTFFKVAGLLAIVLLLAVAGFLYWVLYKKIRSKFPIGVNCWFCNNNFSVPYANVNSWMCPSCDQYNGFTKEGDYNRTITEQFDTSISGPVFNALKSTFTPSKQQTNGFCRLCNINQQLKIQQLALFVPIDESNYDFEIKQFGEKLEKSYRLCAKCETTLEKTLDKQKYDLLKDRLNDSMQQTHAAALGKRTQGSTAAWETRINPTAFEIPRAARTVCVWFNCALTGLILVVSLFKLQGEPGFLFDVYVSTLDSYFIQLISSMVRWFYVRSMEITALGLVTSSILTQKKEDLVAPALWLLLLAASLIQGDSLILFKIAVQLSLVVMLVPPKKHVHKHDIAKKTKKKRNTTPREKHSSNPLSFPNRSIIEPMTIETDLHGLNLGGQSVSSKASNFLFEKHDFAERIKNNPVPLLRPSKLSSWTMGEWSETPTRSSTPSSGYSSQKYDEVRNQKQLVEDLPSPKPWSDSYWMGVPLDHFQRPPQSVFSYQGTPPSGYPVFRYSPSLPPPSPDFYPVSVKQPWSALYTLSVALNLFTLTLVVYALYSGLVSVDWQLPRFEFNFKHR